MEKNRGIKRKKYPKTLEDKNNENSIKTDENAGKTDENCGKIEKRAGNDEMLKNCEKSIKTGKKWREIEVKK